VEAIMDKLIVTSRQGGRKLIDLDRPRMTIGRAPGSDLPVETPLASRVHALLSTRSDGVYVSDLDSSNGTFVNGRKIERHLLRHRDVIRVGDWDIRYIDGNVESQIATTVAPTV
jgi:pSer/pThr/pTyr-binding forkhead associated (FHA) protein